MEYLSTRNDKISLKFEHIFIKGLSEDGGLFLPKKIEKFSGERIFKFKSVVICRLGNRDNIQIYRRFLFKGKASRNC